MLAIDPKHTQSYDNMGICYGNLGHKEEALEAFDKAKEGTQVSMERTPDRLIEVSSSSPSGAAAKK